MRPCSNVTEHTSCFSIFYTAQAIKAHWVQQQETHLPTEHICKQWKSYFQLRSTVNSCVQPGPSILLLGMAFPVSGLAT